MTCRQLGGACDLVFEANTFDDLAKLSKKHGIKMMQVHDRAHLEAMKKMRKLMQTPGAMQEWFDNKRQEFDALPEG